MDTYQEGNLRNLLTSTQPPFRVSTWAWVCQRWSKSIPEFMNSGMDWGLCVRQGHDETGLSARPRVADGSVAGAEVADER